MLRRFLHSLGQAFAEIGYYLRQPLSWFRRRDLVRAKLARDTTDITTAAAGAVRGIGSGVLGTVILILLLPVTLLRSPAAVMGQLRGRPWKELLAGGALALAGLGAVGYAARLILRERSHYNLVAGYTKQLEEQLSNRNRAGAQLVLEGLVKASPEDELAARRLLALQTLDAPASEPRIVRLTMYGQREKGDFAAACREARKLLESLPNDWEANATLLEDALRRNSPLDARQYLQAMPSALTANVGIGQAVYCLQLFAAMGDQPRTDDLLEHVWRSLLPAVRNDIVDKVPPVVRVQLVELYDVSLGQIDRRPPLAGMWVPVQKLCEGVTNDPESKPLELAQIGRLGERQLGHLETLAARKFIPAEEVAGLRAEIEGRLGRLWDRLRQDDPTQAIAYQGQAMHAMRMGNSSAALAALDDGLTKLGPMPEIVEVKARILQRLDPQAGLNFLLGTLKDETLTVASCRTLAEAALSTARPDIALLACERARQMQPDCVWACRIAGEISMKQERPGEAAAALGKIKALLPQDPAACALYVKALCDIGAGFRAEEFVDQLVKGGQPAPAVLACCTALRFADKLDAAIQYADRCLTAEPRDGRVMAALADLVRLKAEKPDGTWERGPFDRSLELYRRAAIAMPDNLALANDIAWMELTGLNQPATALKSLEKMIARATDPTLTPPMLETLGAVLLANGRAEEAKTALERAVKLPGGQQAATYLYLAQVHAALNQRDLAGRALATAGGLSKTPREVRLYEETEQKIRRR